MCKKFILYMLFLCIATVINPCRTFADNNISNTNVYIDVNGQRLYPDAPPILSNDRTLVPVRGIFEKLGADVEWYDDQKIAVVNYNNTTINLQVDNPVASINGVQKQMDVPPMIYNNRTMIPLRFIAENLGMSVQWVGEANLATITESSYFNNLPAKTILGYTTNDYKGDVDSYNSLSKYTGNVTSIAAFAYQIDFDGSLKQTTQPQNDTVKLANSNNVKSLVLIHNFYKGGFDRNLADTVLSDPAKRTALIHNILVTISREAYAGINVNIENVPWNDRDNYTAFVKELKETLTPYGFLTTLSIPAKTYDSQSGDNWSRGFDYSALGKYADQILIMTYDEHFFGGNPGPVASEPWVDRVMSYATQNIPSNKLLLGIAAYGYDWSSVGNKVVMYKNADSLISSQNTQSQWDSSSLSPYFTYFKDGVTHTVWYENSTSISDKLDLVSKYHLGGIGIWRMGFDNDDFWTAVKNKLG